MAHQQKKGNPMFESIQTDGLFPATSGGTILLGSTTFAPGAVINADLVGNVTGNLTGNSVGTHTGDVVGGAVTATSVVTGTLQVNTGLTADLSAGGFIVTDLGNGVLPTDSVRKSYVDSFAAGNIWKSDVEVSSTADLNS